MGRLLVASRWAILLAVVPSLAALTYFLSTKAKGHGEAGSGSSTDP